MDGIRACISNFEDLGVLVGTYVCVDACPSRFCECRRSRVQLLEDSCLDLFSEILRAWAAEELRGWVARVDVSYTPRRR